MITVNLLWSLWWSLLIWWWSCWRSIITLQAALPDMCVKMQEPYYSCLFFFMNCEVLWLKCCFQNALEKLTRFAHWKLSHFDEDWTVHLKNSKNNELFICVVLFSATYLPRTLCMHSECLYGNMTAYRWQKCSMFFFLGGFYDSVGALWQWEICQAAEEGLRLLARATISCMFVGFVSGRTDDEIRHNRPIHLSD